MASKKENDNKAKTGETNTLVTKKSLALALSAPRAPPYGSFHRNVLFGGPLQPTSHWARHFRITDDRHERDNHHARLSSSASTTTTTNPSGDEEEAHSQKPHDTLRQRLKQRLVTKSHFDAPPHQRAFHPHLPAGPEWGDKVTRYLGLVLPLEWQNHCRDSGGFQSICDTLVTASVPSAAIGAPRVAYRFLQRTRQLQHLQYGTHPRQYIHLYLPPKTTTPPRRILFFIHGGAWGSGLPWMYRLVANPVFLQRQWAVAVVGFRPYPDGCIAEQVEDCTAAANHMVKLYPNTPTTLMGHSSGSHTALLMLVDRVIQQLEEKYQQKNNARSESTAQGQRHKGGNSTITILDRNLVNALRNVDSFVGLSGPYDISHHFDYEAARGVEELSPMKPVNGYTRQNFLINSPAQRLKMALAHVHSTHANTSSDGMVSTAAMDDLIPPIVLIHGICDETVPFTSTAEAARVLKSCGVMHCDEIYLAETGHQDVVIQCMMGGPALDATLDWIQAIEKHASSTPLPHDRSLVARSKL